MPAEFELVLEIYSHVLQEDLSIASTPRRIKKTIHSSISKTVGKKLAASLRDEFGSAKSWDSSFINMWINQISIHNSFHYTSYFLFSGPHFDLVARAKLTIDDTDNNTHTHDLVINSVGKLCKEFGVFLNTYITILFFREQVSLPTAFRSLLLSIGGTARMRQ